LPALSDEPVTPQDVFAQTVEMMAAQAKNARIKLENGTVSFGAASPSTKATDDLSRGGRIGKAGRPETPIASDKPSSCCGRNIVELKKSLVTMQAVIEEYARRLHDREDAKAELATMKAYHEAMGGALGVFAASDSKMVAEDAIASFLDALNHVNEAHDRLNECCLSAPKANQQRSS
jgi:hypothetical protein